MLNSPITHTSPTRNIPEAPELGTLAIKDKMLVPNGVRYGGVTVYNRWHVRAIGAHAVLG